MAQEARPTGASVKQRVFGDQMKKAPPDPFLAPFFEAAVEHVWGGVWNRPGLELKYRSLVVVSVLASIGQHEELKTHLRGALNLGWTADELREALLQTSGYAGFPAAHEALRALSEIVNGRVTQEVTRTPEARPSGASIRQRLLGDQMKKAPPDPFLVPFFETAVEHVWGGIWNRPGLDLKCRSLVVVSVLAAIGQHEELKTHLRGALHIGWTADELREALLQISGYAGFSAAHVALRVLSEIVKEG